MANNEISEIPEEVATWTSLKGLNAAKNKISKFPEPFLQLKNLIYLDLNGNQLEGLLKQNKTENWKFLEIDVDLFYSSLPALIKLNLSGNEGLGDETKKKLKALKPEKLDLILWTFA